MDAQILDVANVLLKEFKPIDGNNFTTKFIALIVINYLYSIFNASEAETCA